jgi:hypothetical protein
MGLRQNKGCLLGSPKAAFVLVFEDAGLEGVAVTLASANAQGALQVKDEHFSVADLVGFSRLFNGFDHRFGDLVVYGQLDFDLG